MPHDLTLPSSGAINSVAPISRQIWNQKYRFPGSPERAGDNCIEDTWRRVAKALAAAELPDLRPRFEDEFYRALENFRFLPAGRITAGAGTDRRVTLFNCFVMGTIGDDLGDIFTHVREAALTMQQGGGIGYDFSTLRPKGAPVRGVGADASGPLSFMDVWDSMCRTVMSAGSRRGAMMATMHCSHPDIEAFIDAKRDPARLRNFNLSVLVSDAFMAAVEVDGEWDLIFGGNVYRTVRARDLWDRLMQATYDVAEPGVIFIDGINNRNNLSYCESIQATNPCGEQPLPPYGACLLGSINMARLVRDPFTPDAVIDPEELRDLVRVAVRMMDNTIDVSGFPLDEQRQEALNKRRIGLGMTGVADALAMTGLRYGSKEAAAAAAGWARMIELAAYDASADLAKEKGRFPLFEDAYMDAPTIAGLTEAVRAKIARHGTRNALLTSIAPTGTISLFADNVSSGIEPIFATSYTRKVLQPDGSKITEEVSDYAVRLYRSLYPDAGALPDVFVTAQDLTPEEHVRMQAAVQPHIDSAISKTVNLPEDISFEAFKSVYINAYQNGCKGCTTYRPNEVTGSVLEAAPAAAPATPSVRQQPPALSSASTDIPGSIDLIARGDVLPGATYKVRWMNSEHALYVTVNDIEHDGRRRPFEVFINSKNLEHYSWVVALTRMISAVFRRGGDVAFVAEELKQVFDPLGGQWNSGVFVPSLVAAIGRVIEQHMQAIGFIASDDVDNDKHGHAVYHDAADEPGVQAQPKGKLCPQCSQLTMHKVSGCFTCEACGYSKCSG